MRCTDGDGYEQIDRERRALSVCFGGALMVMGVNRLTRERGSVCLFCVAPAARGACCITKLSFIKTKITEIKESPYSSRPPSRRKEEEGNVAASTINHQTHRHITRAYYCSYRHCLTFLFCFIHKATSYTRSIKSVHTSFGAPDVSWSPRTPKLHHTRITSVHTSVGAPDVIWTPQTPAR
jgi:hypothetical protein